MSFRMNFFIEEEKQAQGQIEYSKSYLTFHFTNVEEDTDGVEFATKYGERFKEESEIITKTLDDLAFHFKPIDSGLDSDSDSDSSDDEDGPVITQKNGYHLKFEIIKSLSLKDSDILLKSIEQTKFFTKETIENLKDNFHHALKKSSSDFYHSPEAQTTFDREPSVYSLRR